MNIIKKSGSLFYLVLLAIPVIFLLIMLLTIMSGLMSCKKDIKIAMADETGKPVINTLINEDSVIYVRISLSDRVAPGTAFNEPSTATITLHENGVVKETLVPQIMFFRKYYCSKTHAVKGNIYKIIADLPGYATAEGSDIVPGRDAVMIQNQRVITTNNGGDISSIISYSITNSSSAASYFRFRLLRAPSNNALLFAPQSAGTGFSNNDNYDFFTPEKLQAGQSEAYNYTVSSITLDSLFLEVTTLTDDSYRYLRSASIAQLNNDNFTAEKTSVYSNIKNGWGIVGGVSVKKYLIKK